MFKKINSLAVCIVILSISMGFTSSVEAQKPLALKGAKVITMAGDTIENGTIVFQDGKIVDVGADIKIPVEARVIDASGKVIMPGFIEAHSSSGMSQANETNPIVPYVSVIDSIDPMNAYFRAARRNGVTSVRISPGNSTVIGGQSAVIKTGGEFIDNMILKSEAGVKISLRPVNGSRMGHLAKLRKALDDAKFKLDEKEGTNDKAKGKKKAAGKSKGKKKGDRKSKGKRAGKKKTEAKKTGEKKEASKSADEKKEDVVESELDRAMFAILKGELPVIIYCDRAMDVGQALRLIKEYNFNASLVLGRDCYKAAKQVAASKLPVVIDSDLVFFEQDPRTKEETKVVLPKVFRDHDVQFAFQVGRNQQTTLGNSYMWYQAATAVKYGMPVEDALKALTVLPAQFLGVDKFVGSIEKGKDGDVIVLSGDPLSVDTWVEMTIVNGQVVYEKEKDDQLKLLLNGESE